MMAGDVTALDKMASPAEAPETKSRPAPSQDAVIGLSPYRVDYSIYISAFSLLILRKAYSRYRNKSLS